MIRNYLLLILSILPGHLLGAGTDTGCESKVYPIDEAKFKDVKDTFCKHIPVPKGEQNFTWADKMTAEDIYELALLNLGHGLMSDATAHEAFDSLDLKWKKTVLDKIAYISKATCNTEAISGLFVAGIKNLFLYYLVKIEKSGYLGRLGPQLEPDMHVWNKIIEALTKCEKAVKPIKIVESCGKLKQFNDQTGSPQPAGKMIRELFDSELERIGKGSDMIVDSMWWMFSATYARCYKYMYPDEDIILNFFSSFQTDFINRFNHRWRGAGEVKNHFNLIFGHLNATREAENIRSCAYVAFSYEDLLHKHLIRPVVTWENLSPKPNYKV